MTLILKSYGLELHEAVDVVKKFAVNAAAISKLSDIRRMCF